MARTSTQVARRRSLLLAAAVGVALSASACGEDVDITKALSVTNVVTGYYDVGIVAGKNKLVPSVSFQVLNAGDVDVSSVQLNAVFRVIGDQEELGSAFVRGIDSSGLAPGQSTTPFVLRSSLGYTGEQSRAQMLQHSSFRDVQVELFAKHGADDWVSIGRFQIDRQLLTN
ncbi:MAG: hypothetical protein AB7I50_19865 [Vicinamibacterales bacterium]